MMASPRTMQDHFASPCIALRRCKTPDSPDFGGPRNLDFVPRLRNASSSSLNKLTGSPGYVTGSEGYSPTKVLPSKPHHVRGGSISSDMSEISNVDQIIPIQPCDAQMLVPLLHRHLEMKELVANNLSVFERLRNAFGQTLFDKCIALWTQTTRAQMGDLEWLIQTKNLLRGQDNWTLWCDVVGWDSRELLLGANSPESGSVREFSASVPDATQLDVRRGSRRSSMSIATELTINEDPEE